MPQNALNAHGYKKVSSRLRNRDVYAHPSGHQVMQHHTTKAWSHKHTNGILTTGMNDEGIIKHLGKVHTVKEEHRGDAARDRSVTVRRELDAAARSKAAKRMLDDAAARKRSTMKENFTPIADVITLVANDQHAEATGIVNDLLSARVLDSLQAHKETIAQSLFVPSADSLQEEVVQEEHESVEDFVKRGGKIKQVAPGKAYGSQKPQTIKKAKQYFVKKG